MVPPYIVIMAAGQGKRMQSDLPKVLHPILFKPMIHYVIDLSKSIAHDSVFLVVGHGEDEVRRQCKGFSDLNFVKQEKQLGTADAVRSVVPFLKKQTGTVVILSGDVILLRRETLNALVEQHHETAAICTVATAVIETPRGYGRMLRNKEGELLAIREEADCNEAEREVKEVNSGIYVFELSELLPLLQRIDQKNKQGEFYLTDVIRLLVAQRKKVCSFKLDDPEEMEGINDRVALGKVEKVVRARINESLMMNGVTLTDPETTRIDGSSRIERDVAIEGGCTIIGSSIGQGSYIEAGSRIRSSTIDQDCHVKQGSYIESGKMGKRCSVGPYAHLRPHSILGDDVKIGNFVEVKKSKIGDGSKASHLSYIGDAEVGTNVNLGCGFITCNYDGSKKHETIIEDDVFIGSDSQTVAPIRIGKGSYIASGSTITENVPPDSLALSRGRQITKPGYARKYEKSKD